jgi:acyl carrier protein
LRPVPPGTVGELYAAGDGLARGYLNNPKATEQKFVRNPFAAELTALMYRTGDLARLNVAGLIEFIGRADNQVKIQGHRIEPGEVESALGTHVSVKQSCVVAHTEKNGSKRLVAYYVCSPSTVEAAELRKFLADKLPQHMVPAQFVLMNSLPLTPNGKVDRAALPAPSITVGSDRTVNAAKSQLEQTIIATWREFLGAERIGPNDNFFDLGGNSLLLVRIHADLQKALEVKFPITALFEFTTVRLLANYLGGQNSPGSSVSDAQQRAHKQRAAFARQRERRIGSAT